MRIIVDIARCELHGECTVVAPDLFVIGADDTTVTITDPAPSSEEDVARAEHAGSACPSSAIRVVG